MKALIMGAGYAVRLYPLTKDKAKPLLPVAQKPIIEYIIEKLEVFSEIDRIYVVTNNKFYNQFKEWAENFSYHKPIEIINDGTLSNEDRLGAIGDIHYVVSTKNVTDDLIIIAGDNLFDFDLGKLKEYFVSKKLVICAYDVKDKELAKKYGIVSIDSKGRVISFVEKPAVPPSTFAALGIYLFKHDAVDLFEQYVSEGNNRDAPGYFIQWAYQRTDVYAYPFQGTWYDIGDLASYEQANKVYEKKLTGIK